MIAETKSSERTRPWSEWRSRELQAYLRAYLDSRNGPLLPGEAAPVIRIVRALDYLERRRARSEGLAVLPARERGRERGS